ncbi:MAG TPA: hypothetical protein VI233_11605, partial [Puia sp.]
MRLGLILKFLLLVLGIFLFIFLWEGLPIISGYGAKVAASGVFVAGRPAADVLREDLGSIPVCWASVKVNLADSSVTASVCGLARRKAIYRRGLGVTLVSELSGEAIRAQHMELAKAPAVRPDTTNWPTGDRGAD